MGSEPSSPPKSPHRRLEVTQSRVEMFAAPRSTKQKADDIVGLSPGAGRGSRTLPLVKGSSNRESTSDTSSIN
jgi:hypothetical protein